MRTTIRAALVGAAVVPFAAITPGLAFAGEAAPAHDTSSHAEHPDKDDHGKKNGHEDGHKKHGEWTHQEAESSNGLPDLAGLPIGPEDVLALLTPPALPELPVATPDVPVQDEAPAAEEEPAADEPAAESPLPESPLPELPLEDFTVS